MISIRVDSIVLDEHIILIRKENNIMLLNRISGLIVVIIGIILYFWLIPLHTESGDYGWLKPTTLPNVTAIIVLVAGMVHFIFPTGKAEFDLAFSGRVGLFFLVGVFGLYLMSIFGFIIVAPILVMALMLMVGERRLLWLSTGIVALPGLIWFLVGVLLNRPLP